MRIEWKSCLRIGVSAFVLYLAVHYWDKIFGLLKLAVQAALPLLLGCVMAYIANILMRFYERRIAPKAQATWWLKAKRPICLLLAVVTVLLVLFLLFQLIVPQLVACVQVLLGTLPEMLGDFTGWLEETFQISAMLEWQGGALPGSEAEWRQLIDDGLKLLINGMSGVLGLAISAITSVVGGLVTLFMSIIFAIYILLGKEQLSRQFHRLMNRALGASITARVDDVLHLADDCFHSYIVGQCVEALILGGLCTLGMLILQLPYAVMIGAMVGVTALIPVMGAYIGAAFGAIMIFSVSAVQAIIFLIFLVVLQQIEGNLIYPRTVGSSLGLPAIWVLAAVTIGGSLLGVVGMLVFVPLTAVSYRLLKRYANQKKEPTTIQHFRLD